MILITDGGSTKCDWVLLDDAGEVVLATQTQGLNPAVIPKEELFDRIQLNEDLVKLFDTVITIDFYGAGCGTKAHAKFLHEVLTSLFPNAKISINEDTVAAVYAVTNTPGIVCILGTGSNSCYFDGEKIHSKIPSLGYSVMDEASGNYYGKQLLRDYFYKKMPIELTEAFEKRFNLDVDEIKTNLYQRPNPNMYLASFAEFIFSSEELNSYFYTLISEGVHKFLEQKVLCYEQAKKVPIHFVGSIAYFSETVIRDCMKSYDLELGTIIKHPIDGLIEYYKKNKILKS